MMKHYFPEHKKYVENYDDIYPSILKQQPSHFKNVFSYVCLFVLYGFGIRYVIQRKHKDARNSRTLTN